MDEQRNTKKKFKSKILLKPIDEFCICLLHQSYSDLMKKRNKQLECSYSYTIELEIRILE